MTERNPTLKGVTCSGCGAWFAGTGAHATHCKWSTTCTYEMRFWGKVNKTDGCWLWTGFLNHDGYGRVGPRPGIDNGGRAHRRAWELTKGPIPKGAEVMHICDTPACVRPDHLRLGSHGENMADMRAKGRMAVGERYPNAKLTESMVREIRAEYTYSKAGRRTTKSNANELAARYGVGRSTIVGVAMGRIWGHVK